MSETIGKAPVEVSATPHFVKGVLVCPRCGNDELEAVSDGVDTNFLCHECWWCWHWDLGYMIHVAVKTCPGCYHKEECVRRLGLAAPTSP